jgi:hypothetical protein
MKHFSTTSSFFPKNLIFTKTQKNLKKIRAELKALFAT